MNKQKGQLIVALDVDTSKEALALVDSLSKVVDIFKVGSQLFTACGPKVVQEIIKRGKRVFLDLKFHDIPNTVANAVNSTVGLGVFMCTIHTLGGKEMMQRAVEAASKNSQKLKVAKPLIIGVTVLTSEKKADNIQHIVLERACLAKDCGLDGVVASPQEVKMIRQKLGRDFLIVTPGIRPVDADSGDQKRVGTPQEAIKDGSNFLVVGRPIIQSSDPLKAAQKFLKEFQ